MGSAPRSQPSTRATDIVFGTIRLRPSHRRTLAHPDLNVAHTLFDRRSAPADAEARSSSEARLEGFFD
jgi:hypothetical protein